ncbi:MAG TPA: hypothetical protein DEA96_13800, partial [Leptospiraceae bacterium]|nr:hypothetical protein [Leptospiraceae bacterium]
CIAIIPHGKKFYSSLPRLCIWASSFSDSFGEIEIWRSSETRFRSFDSSAAPEEAGQRSKL